MKILGTGLRGLVGSRIVELLKDKYELDLSDVDITDRVLISEKIKNSDASIVLHLAAKTDVDGCEKDKDLGVEGEAWKINVIGTKNVADACLASNKKLIYISTDFVFDGTKDVYSEEDIPNPVNWYAKTKYEGEKIVQNLSTPWMIMRIAYPYRSSFERSDFARTILTRLQSGRSVLAITDQIFTPTFIDDIAKALDSLIVKEATGLFHAAGGQSLSPFDAAIIIAKTFDLNQSLISKITRSEFFKDRAVRPFQLRIKNARIEKLGIKMVGFEEGLREILKQVQDDTKKI